LVSVFRVVSLHFDRGIITQANLLVLHSFDQVVDIVLITHSSTTSSLETVFAKHSVSFRSKLVISLLAKVCIMPFLTTREASYMHIR
jgi:hypothetical protein